MKEKKTEILGFKTEQAKKPGPGSYNPNKMNVMKKESSWKIGSAVRRDLNFDKKNSF